MSIQALIIDFFDVLYGEQDTTRLRAFEADHNLPAGGLRQAMSHSRYFNAARLGQVSGEVLWRDIAAQIGTDPDDWQTLVSIYDASFGINQELVAFLQTLRPRYRIALLSNATPHVRGQISQHFQLDHLFDVIVISAEEGVKKPEPESYQLTLQRLHAQPQETAFLDDDQSYVAAAQALGLHGITFHTTAQAIKDLTSLL